MPPHHHPHLRQHRHPRTSLRVLSQLHHLLPGLQKGHHQYQYLPPARRVNASYDRRAGMRATNAVAPARVTTRRRNTRRRRCASQIWAAWTHAWRKCSSSWQCLSRTLKSTSIPACSLLVACYCMDLPAVARPCLQTRLVGCALFGHLHSSRAN